MRFKFKTSIHDDVWNWHETLTKLGGYGQDWLRGWPSDLDKDKAKDKNVIKSYLYQNYYKDRLVQKYAAWMQVATNPEEVAGPLLKITGHKVPFDEVYVKITTGTRCPYDSDEGGFYSYYGLPVSRFYRTAMHECMHLIVHKHYWKKMLAAGLTNPQAHDIKEALTVLLNPIFEKWNWPEKGYPNHQNLRKDIEKIAKNTKSFKKIIDESILIFMEKYSDQVS